MKARRFYLRNPRDDRGSFLSAARARPVAPGCLKTMGCKACKSRGMRRTWSTRNAEERKTTPQSAFSTTRRRLLRIRSLLRRLTARRSVAPESREQDLRPATRLSTPGWTRGFPSPPYSGFGFIRLMNQDIGCYACRGSRQTSHRSESTPAEKTTDCAQETVPPFYATPVRFITRNHGSMLDRSCCFLVFSCFGVERVSFSPYLFTPSPAGRSRLGRSNIPLKQSDDCGLEGRWT